MSDPREQDGEVSEVVRLDPERADTPISDADQVYDEGEEAGPDARTGSDIHELLALASLGQRCLTGRDESLPVRRGDEQLHLGPRDQQLHDIHFGIQIDEQPHGLTEAARTRQLVAG